jgi:hypothetical protein
MAACRRINEYVPELVYKLNFVLNGNNFVIAIFVRLFDVLFSDKLVEVRASRGITPGNLWR